MTLNLDRRQLLTLAGLGAGAAALSACGGPQTTPSGGGSQSSAADDVDWGSITPATEITFWSNHPGGSEAVTTEIIDAFNASGAGITVSLVTAGANYEEVAQRFQTQQAAGDLPDLVIFSDVWWFRYYMQGSITPLDGLLDAAEIDPSKYVQGLWSDYTYNDRQWAVPFARSTPLFYYNKEHWAAAGLEDRAPETWAEFAEWAPALMSANGTPAAYQLPALADYAGWVFQNNLWGWGGGWSKEGSFDLITDSEESVAAITFLQHAVYTDKWAAVSAQSASDDVAAGAASATIQSTGSLVGFQEAAPFELGVGFLPGGPALDQPVCPTGGAGLGIPSQIDPERQLAAAIFLSYLTNPENTATFAGATGYMPVRTDADASAIIAANPAAETAISQLDRIRPQDFARVFIPGADQEIAQACGDILTQQADVAERLGTLSSTLESIYTRDVEPNI